MPILVWADSIHVASTICTVFIRSVCNFCGNDQDQNHYLRRKRNNFYLGGLLPLERIDRECVCARARIVGGLLKVLADGPLAYQHYLSNPFLDSTNETPLNIRNHHEQSSAIEDAIA